MLLKGHPNYRVGKAQRETRETSWEVSAVGQAWTGVVAMQTERSGHTQARQEVTTAGLAEGLEVRWSELPPRLIPRASFPEPGIPREAQSWHVKSGVPLPHWLTFTVSVHHEHLSRRALL